MDQQQSQLEQIEPNTPAKIKSLSSNVAHLRLSPASRAALDEYRKYMEAKVVTYRIIDPNSKTLIALRSGVIVTAPASLKLIKGPRTLNRDYIVAQKRKIAETEAKKLEKARLKAERAAEKESRQKNLESQIVTASKRKRAPKKATPKTPILIEEDVPLEEGDECDHENLARELEFLEIMGGMYIHAVPRLSIEF